MAITVFFFFFVCSLLDILGQMYKQKASKLIKIISQFKGQLLFNKLWLSILCLGNKCGSECKNILFSLDIIFMMKKILNIKKFFSLFFSFFFSPIIIKRKEERKSINIHELYSFIRSR